MGSLRTSPAQGRADARQVVPAVPQRVVLNHELRRHRRAKAQREWRCLVEFGIGQGSHRGGRFTAVFAQQFKRCGLARWLAGA